VGLQNLTIVAARAGLVFRSADAGLDR